MIVFGLASLLAPMGIGPNPIDEPGTPPGFDPDTVTPGVAGFVAIALVAIAAIFLMVDMSRRIRRVRYRGEIRERMEAEQLMAEQLIDEKQMVAEGGPAEPDPAALAAERRVDRDQ
ncbi:hypothetical protein [Microcella sp.]|uniref:hypothetical protein n=1 Tax=Microcella sp. TaxID=1913979 RepID=UPI00345B5BBA